MMIDELMSVVYSQLFSLVSLGLGVAVGAVVSWKFRAALPRQPTTMLTPADLMSTPTPSTAIMEESKKNWFGGDEESKMVMVVRTDLGMQKGKIASQCAHAALGCYKKALKTCSNWVRGWENSGQAKVVLKTETEESLYELQAVAMSLGLVAKVIHDAGRTQIAAGSATVVGIGPGPVSLVNQVTGHLKLY